MKVKDFRRNIRKFGEKKNPAFWCGAEYLMFVPSLKRKPEEWAEHRQNEEIEENEVKSIKTTALKRFNYLTINKQSITFWTGRIHEI